ncbi:hypothetical protein PGKDCPLP_00850 [Stenotrophomonas maltophilia]|nr:hypothetical protein PGKDCPLP_00850 [Stenotrophomonas maltophilia]
MRMLPLRGFLLQEAVQRQRCMVLRLGDGEQQARQRALLLVRIGHGVVRAAVRPHLPALRLGRCDKGIPRIFARVRAVDQPAAGEAAALQDMHLRIGRDEMLARFLLLRRRVHQRSIEHHPVAHLLGTVGRCVLDDTCGDRATAARVVLHRLAVLFAADDHPAPRLLDHAVLAGQLHADRRRRAAHRIPVACRAGRAHVVPVCGVGFFQQLHQLRIAGLRLAEATGFHVHPRQRTACAMRARRGRQQRLRGLLQCRPVGHATGALHLAPVREHRHAAAIGISQLAQAFVVALLGQPAHQRVGGRAIILRVCAHEAPQQCARFRLRPTGAQRGGSHLGQRLVIWQLRLCLQQPLRLTFGIARLVLLSLFVQPNQ